MKTRSKDPTMAFNNKAEVISFSVNLYFWKQVCVTNNLPRFQRCDIKISITVGGK